MSFLAPLPLSVREKLSANTHPGLLLDKYVASWDPSSPAQKLSELVQKPAVQGVAVLSQQEPPGLDFAALRERRAHMLEALEASVWRGATIGALTLHLARASALENAGICLHPLYGFAYLPGSGLKGMARAFAETMWLPAQYTARLNPQTGRSEPADREQRTRAEGAWRRIEAVFGWAPNSDVLPAGREKPWKPDGVPPRSKEDAASAGAIVFHEAWPEQWPRLVVDILNNHHRTYYQDGEPPGDWDAPVPVYFLAVPPGQGFTFAISKRRGDAPQAWLDLAQEWLIGALVHHGAGAKTAAGYGGFRIEPAAQEMREEPEIRQARERSQTVWSDLEQANARASIACTLELVTPAFLAGSNQQAEDCELRPATLRGLLRWWWRTLHAGHVDAATLRSMEAAVWGDTRAGGPLRLVLDPISVPRPLVFDKKFLSQKNALPAPANNKTTQGLWYHSFGMDDNRREGGQVLRCQRFFLAPGATWTLRLIARPSVYDDQASRDPAPNAPQLDAAAILDQGKAALWLLCHFGGVGSKSRKGFGSLNDPPELASWGLADCQQRAKEFRQACGALPQSRRSAGSPSLEQMLSLEEVSTDWTNYWFALDQVAAAAQQFAQQHKHNIEKKALGLPRNVRPPVRGTFKPGNRVRKSDRHASPALYHLARGKTGLTIRVAAFPSPELPYDPSCAKSRQFLEQLLDFLKHALPQRIAAQRGKGRTAPVDAGPPTHGGARPAARTPMVKVKPGDSIEVVLAADPKGQNRPFACYEPLGLTGAIVNAKDMPEDWKVGDRLKVLLHSLSKDGKQIMFRAPIADRNS